MKHLWWCIFMLVALWIDWKATFACIAVMTAEIAFKKGQP